MGKRLTRNLKQKLLQRTQRRLNRLMRLLRMSHISKRANSDSFDELFLTRSLAKKMFTNGFSIGPFGLHLTTQRSVAPTAMPVELEATTPSEVETLETEVKNICNDIRGRDRACCNSASRCFDDVRGVVDELDNSPVDSFSLMSACRKVSAELKRDKICVQRSLSRCGGPDRAILQRRFDGRVDTLYNQFYKHCRRDTRRTTSTTSTTSLSNPHIAVVATNNVTSTDAPPPAATVPEWTGSNAFPNVTPHDHSGHSHVHTGNAGDNGASSGSGVIVAGAVTGGIVLGLVLLIAVIFWCKNRRYGNGSNGSSDSTGIFFQKRPNVFSTDRPRGDNNNKPPVTRQESEVYAEIDEAMVNPGYKPPVPGSLPHMGYLSPVSDDDSGSYTSPPANRSTGVVAATTRGQLSYGPILAANRESGQKKNLFYHSTSVTDRSIQNHDFLLSPRNLPSTPDAECASGELAYTEIDSHDASHKDSLDDYEEPVSANTSVRYTDLKDVSSPPPKYRAPHVPSTDIIGNTPPTTPKKNGVKVLPSNPFVPFTGPQVSQSPDPTTQPTPTAKPRRKKTQNNETSQSKTSVNSTALDKLGEQELIRRSDVLASSRDSTASDGSIKSSHHYFVLEPGHTQMDYENSVSAPKLV